MEFQAGISAKYTNLNAVLNIFFNTSINNKIINTET